MTGASASPGPSQGRPRSDGDARDPHTRRRKIEPIPDGAVPVIEATNISKAFGA
ncbi:MAG: hypothetical protein JO288_11785, partial [Hyphomicrobiales bacterium]|nr:hypothetical protein [Hyphomicrobiales bacterium]